MQYKIFTEEINRIHGEYLITADSEEEALELFNAGMFDDTPGGDIWSNEITEKCFYSLDGKHTSTPRRGLNIIRMSDGTTKKVILK